MKLLALIVIAIFLVTSIIPFTFGEIITSPEHMEVNISRGDSVSKQVQIINKGTTSIKGELIGTDFSNSFYPDVTLSEDYIELEPGETINISVEIITDSNDKIIRISYIILFKENNDTLHMLVDISINVYSRFINILVYVIIFGVPIVIISYVSYRKYKLNNQ